MAIGNVAGLVGIAPSDLSQRPQRSHDTGIDAPAAVTTVLPRPDSALAPSDVDGALPVDAPPGTDPELWSVLTTAERRFYSKLHETGPLTYGPKTANTPPGLVRGVRFDRTV